MPQKLLVVALAGAVAVAILGWRSSRWHVLSGDGFQVMMKGNLGEPSLDHQRAELGSVSSKQWRSEPFFGGESFMTMTLDLDALPPGYSMDAGLESIVGGIVQRSNGSLKGETPIEVAGMSGKQFEVELKPSGRILLRGFSRDRRIYLLAFKWRDPGAPPPEAAKFFDSFALQ